MHDSLSWWRVTRAPRSGPAPASRESLPKGIASWHSASARDDDTFPRDGERRALQRIRRGSERVPSPVRVATLFIIPSSLPRHLPLPSPAAPDLDRGGRVGSSRGSGTKRYFAHPPPLRPIKHKRGVLFHRPVLFTFHTIIRFLFGTSPVLGQDGTRAAHTLPCRAGR